MERTAISLPIDVQRGNKRKSLADFAYTALRSAIQDGRFDPGERLPETAIGEWLGISRTPVREAFRRLISEGLLVLSWGNGVTVVEPDHQVLIELYAVREALEGMAARLSALQASEAEVRLIWDIYEREEAALNHFDALPRINADLHRAINRAAHNRHLLQSLEWLDTAVGILRYPTFAIPGNPPVVHKQHLDIISAISHRNPAAAEAAGRHHVVQSLCARLKLISKQA